LSPNSTRSRIKRLLIRATQSNTVEIRLPSNTVFQPTRCAALARQDRWHFDISTDLLMPYSRSERLNTGRWVATHQRCTNQI